MDLADSALLRACRQEPTPRPPVWFMRQAGRALPEYRKRLAEIGLPMMRVWTRPDLIAELTLQPVRRYGVDAAILFSDITVPLRAAGVDVEIAPGVGPVVAEPIRGRDDLAQLPSLAEPDTPYVAEAVRALVAELGPVPLIGFAGAPFTLATYLIEGGPSRHYERTKALMYGEPAVWAELMDRLAELTATFLTTQVAAGASAVQLFDSWAGTLSARDYADFVLPASRKALASVPAGVPRIHFGVGTGEFLDLIGSAGADVVGVDWRVPLAEAARRVGPGRAVQGNLDPAILLAPWPVVEREVRSLLAEGAGLPGHIVNLGHGVLPATDPDVLTRVVDLVHETG
jgi:uroporphyrinogen decarboxylase